MLRVCDVLSQSIPGMIDGKRPQVGDLLSFRIDDANEVSALNANGLSRLWSDDDTARFRHGSLCELDCLGRARSLQE